jgi:patatin-related protein
MSAHGAPADRCPEIRVGLVLYGGSSLAVYMGGVAVEFLRAVRAGTQTRPPSAEDSPYRALLDRLGHRLVVDVIAGTSAGGINGVFLARALATGGNLDALHDLWRQKGDFAALLDWSQEKTPPESLANGRFFLKALEEAVGTVGQAGDKPLVPVLDLFVTGTDVAGRYWSRKDFLKHQVRGRQHTKLFHLKLRQKFTLGTCTEEELGYDQNDFVGQDQAADQAVQPKLARLCRTTAAFPGVFEPVAFSPADAYGDETTPSDEDRTAIWMTDGGVLMNHPFEPVIETIFHRAADNPVQRLLFYVEPALDVEEAPDKPSRSNKPSALGTVGAAFTLPMYQGIDQHLKEIEAHNQVVAQIQAAGDAMEKAAAPAGAVLPNLDGNPAYQAYLTLRFHQTCDELQQRLAAAYRRYCQTAAATARPAPTADEVEKAFQAWAQTQAKSQRAFLDAHDLAFEQRRVHYTLEQVRRFYERPDSPGGEQLQLIHQTLCDQKATLWRLLEHLLHRDWQWWSSEPGRPAGADVALRQAFAPPPGADAPTPADSVAAFMAAHAEILRSWRERHGDAHHEAMRPAEFEARDMVLLPLSVGSSLGTRDTINWVRISPYDADAVLKAQPDGVAEPTDSERFTLGHAKVAGDALGNFGGFLSWRWRANDYMWGRLDTADLLIRSLEQVAHDLQQDDETFKDLARACREAAFKEILKAELLEEDLQELAAQSPPARVVQRPRPVLRPEEAQAMQEAFQQAAASAQPSEEPPAPGPVDRLNWPDIHRFLRRLLQQPERNTLKQLHPGVLIHDGLDAAENARQVIGGIVKPYKNRLPAPLRSLGSAAGYIIGWARAVIKPLVPAPGVGEDDRAPAFWKWAGPLALAAGGWILGRLGLTGTVVILLGLTLIALVAAAFRGSLNRLLDHWPRVPAFFWQLGLLLLVIGDTATLQHVGGTALLWGTKTPTAGMVTDAGVALLGAWAVFALPYLVSRWVRRKSLFRVMAALILFVGALPVAILTYNAFVSRALPKSPAAATVTAFALPRLEGRRHPPEGIALAPDGSPLVTTVDGYVLRKEVDGFKPVGQKFDSALGLVADPLGGYLVIGIQNGTSGVYRLAPGASQWELVTAVRGVANGLAASGRDIWVSTEIRGFSVWYIHRPEDGSKPSPRRLGYFWMPNGLAIRSVKAEDGSQQDRLLVAETASGRLLEVPARPGDPGTARVLARLPIGQFPDGVLALSNGQIAVSANAGYVYLVDPQTRAITAARRFNPAQVPANMAERDGQIWFAGIGKANLFLQFPGEYAGHFAIPQ